MSGGSVVGHGWAWGGGVRGAVDYVPMLWLYSGVRGGIRGVWWVIVWPECCLGPWQDHQGRLSLRLRTRVFAVSHCLGGVP